MCWLWMNAVESLGGLSVLTAPRVSNAGPSDGGVTQNVKISMPKLYDRKGWNERLHGEDPRS